MSAFLSLCLKFGNNPLAVIRVDMVFPKTFFFDKTLGRISRNLLNSVADKSNSEIAISLS